MQALIKTQQQTMYVSDQVRHFSLFIYLCVILDTIRVISSSEGVRTVNVPTPSLSSSPTLPYLTIRYEEKLLNSYLVGWCAPPDARSFAMTTSSVRSHLLSTCSSVMQSM